MTTFNAGRDLTPTTTLPVPANLTARLAALQVKATQGGEVWHPQPGDTLTGQIVGHEKGIGPYGEGWLMRVRDAEGGMVRVWLTKWLLDTLKTRNAEVGDLIALQYLGKQESKRGQRYNAYTLALEKP